MKEKKGFFIKSLILLGVLSSILSAGLPNAPGLYVGVTKLTNTSVKITAKDNSNDESGFSVLIYDYSTSSLFKTISVPNSDNSQLYAKVIGLTCDKTYKATIVAHNSDGNSTESNVRYFNLKSTFGASCEDDTAVKTAEELALEKIVAFASDNSSPMPTFQDYIDAGVTGINAGDLNSINGTVGELVGEDVDTLVKLQEVIDNIVPVDILTLNAPGPYIGISKIVGSSTSVRVSFKDNSNNEDGFRVFDGNTISKNVLATNNSTVYTTLTGLTCDAIYQIKAIAYKNLVSSEETASRAFRISSTLGVQCPEAKTPKILALEKIAAYAHNNANPTPTIQDYVDTEATKNVDDTQGITAGNLDEMNQVVDALETLEISNNYALQLLWVLNLECLDGFHLSVLVDNLSFTNHDITNLNTSCVTNMYKLFEYNRDFNQDISNWDVSNVINMESMFAGSKFNQDIGSWDVSKVENMGNMFGTYRFHGTTRYSEFNQDISNWNVSNITNMAEMFFGARNFNDNNLSNWDVSSVTNHQYFGDNWGTGNTEPIW